MTTSYIHASCVELKGRGLLIRGQAGSGKSSFALSLINRGFKLVADDLVHIFSEKDQLIAQPAKPLKGLLEVRGIGIIQLMSTQYCMVDYIVDLVPGIRTERLPELKTTDIQDIPVRSFRINPTDPYATEKALILFHQDFLGFHEHQQNELMELKAS